MPLIQSNFRAKSYIFRNAHAATIYASLLRPLPRVKFKRERLELSDGDFLDLDWKKQGANRLVIILPGLEGKSNSLYARACVRYFYKEGWDAMGMNYRGCSGEPNRLLRGYHMGASDDVKTVVEHSIEAHGYKEIVLVGYSLGGNLALKYAGEECEDLPKEMKSVIAFSAPLDIEKSDARLNKWYNWHYLKWFMFPLNLKANRKKKQFPQALKNYQGFFMSGNFTYFDKHFTAPANGYATVEEYWQAATAKPYLKDIQIPALLVSAEDDTFISENCYPVEAAEENSNLYLEIPEHGGHCGFIRNFFEPSWWMEERALAFAEFSLRQEEARLKEEKILPEVFQ